MASLPLISREFAAIDNINLLSKLMLTIPALFIAMIAPFSGGVIDRYGRLRSLYFGIAMFIIGGTSGVYLSNFWLILIGRAVLGIGVAFVMTSATTLIGDYLEGEARHKFMGMQGAFTAIGGILFVGGGGFLADIDWRGPFFIYFIPLLFLPLLLTSLYEPQKEHHEAELSPKVFSGILPGIYLTAFGLMVIFYLLPTQMPFLIINEVGGNPSTVGIIVAFAMTVSATMAMNYAKIKARLSFASVFTLMFFLLSIGLQLLSLAHQLPMFLLGAAFTGSGMGLMMVNINAWMLTHAPKQIRGRVTGMTVGATFLGQFASPLVFEFLIEDIGVQGLFKFISIAMLALAATLLSMRLFKKLRA